MAAFMLAIALGVASPVTALAQTGAAPYDERLSRLSEVLGSIHYLRNLCGDVSNDWREQMETLLTVERPAPNRRARLISSFNKGYRTFDSVYTACTPQAIEAVDAYMSEGKTLALEINNRYAQ
ncbi:TIGR02301 family protein [Ahrensia kielensis]|uniref:TIGR02301 family protein n=1 Tax=Ahrensia kielensis TaxID=76980 RepID=A0ABU9T304_9HYPH